MNLYVTVDEKSKLKKAFFNLRKQKILDVEEVAAEIGYSLKDLDEYSSFIINERIQKIISVTAAGKKMQSIIYVNHSINEEIIQELISFCHEKTKIEKIIFLTERHFNEKYYELFEEILFFPSLKKVHIVNCEPVPVIWLAETEISEDFLAS